MLRISVEIEGNVCIESCGVPWRKFLKTLLAPISHKVSKKKASSRRLTIEAKRVKGFQGTCPGRGLKTKERTRSTLLALRM